MYEAAIAIEAILAIAISILHFTKGTAYLRRGSSYGQARGTVGSGLTPGSPLGRRTPEIPENSGQNQEKPENSGKDREKPENSGKSRKLHVTYQIKALGLLVHVDMIKFWKIPKNS